MKKITLIFLIGTLFFNCESRSTDLTFNPQNKRVYEVELNSKILSLFFEIEAEFENRNDSIIMRSKLTKITYKDGSDYEEEMNAGYQRYVNDVITTIYDKRGRRIDSHQDSEVFNTELLVAELPKEAITKGSSWTGQKSAKPDIVFETINTNYTCSNITDTATKLDVSMTFSESEQNNGMKFTKTYNGYYNINSNGVVESAKLNMSGFTGFSSLTGYIEIKTLIQ